MIGERKSDIFNLIPDKFIPVTRLISKGDTERAAMEAEKIGFPIIAKPDIGERGNWVSKLHSQEQLKTYVETCPVDFLLQEMVDLPIELGVFYVKYPGTKGRVTSIVRKDFLSVVGDGKHSVIDLLKKSTRATMTADLDSDYLKLIGSDVPEKGKRVLVEPIGNHCRGTKFLSDNHEIDSTLDEAFNMLSDQIPDFYFGRYDLKCQSYADLKGLKNFKILELNGAGAEPAHIYQPGYPLWKAYKDILWHLSVLSDISRLNRKRGYPYWNFKQGYQKWKAHQRYNRLLANS